MKNSKYINFLEIAANTVDDRAALAITRLLTKVLIKDELIESLEDDLDGRDAEAEYFNSIESDDLEVLRKGGQIILRDPNGDIVGVGDCVGSALEDYYECLREGSESLDEAPVDEEEAA